ncbi:MAG: hypothetical protein RRC34_16710 [Lentisphaeria bacterium]|nr:hypothetical protein [Lentisphaeria bacterium]
MTLTPPKTADELLDMYYHDLRSYLLEVAAGFDRIERAGNTDDHRLAKLRAIATIAVDDNPDRAARLLTTLSVD